MESIKQNDEEYVKGLGTFEGYRIGVILKNYTVTTPTGGRTYYANLSGAVRKVARMVSDEEAKTLNQWLVVFEAATTRIIEELK